MSARYNRRQNDPKGVLRFYFTDFILQNHFLHTILFILHHISVIENQGSPIFADEQTESQGITSTA